MVSWTEGPLYCTKVQAKWVPAALSLELLMTMLICVLIYSQLFGVFANATPRILLYYPITYCYCTSTSGVQPSWAACLITRTMATELHLVACSSDS